jgi:hypothetical protein
VDLLDWDELQALPFTSIALAEIRRPEFVQTIVDLDRDEQDELSGDLSERLGPADEAAPRRLSSRHRRSGTHVLLESSLAESDVPDRRSRRHGCTPEARSERALAEQLTPTLVDGMPPCRRFYGSAMHVEPGTSAAI